MGPRLPDCCVSFLLNALTKLLVLFCLLYRAWRPLEERCDGVDCQAAEEAVAARDVLRIFLFFRATVEKRTFYASSTSSRVMEGSRLWDLTSRGPAPVDRVDGALWCLRALPTIPPPFFR
ncbi:hypothetical protein TcYC6_0100990 [Trypanosoma cruzi]|nr:hypothetical protein TcYC6_0100990 [Trypanosoma cruzi]